MTDTVASIVPSDDHPFSELKQVTVRADDEIARSTSCWPTVAPGEDRPYQRRDRVRAGKMEEKKRARLDSWRWIDGLVIPYCVSSYPYQRWWSGWIHWRAHRTQYAYAPRITRMCT